MSLSAEAAAKICFFSPAHLLFKANYNGRPSWFNQGISASGMNPCDRGQVNKGLDEEAVEEGTTPQWLAETPALRVQRTTNFGLIAA